MQNIKLGIATAKIELRRTIAKEEVVLPEPKFYKELSLLGRSNAIDVFVFSANELSIEDGRLYGYCYEYDSWVKKLVAFPDIVYDRCFFATSKERQRMENVYAYLRKQHPFQLFNNSLPSKLVVNEQLSSVNKLLPYLPYTVPIVSISVISRLLSQYPAGVVVKPASGMHGKGVIHISYDEQQCKYLIYGRGLKNEPLQANFSRELALLKWFYKFKRDISYVIQPYFSFRTEHNCPFDIRVLLQKDFTGHWQQTGTMARVGTEHGLTSNLHGGGEAMLPLPLLTEKLGSVKAEHLIEEIHMISGQTAIAIEENFGRFGELAFDFGVTMTGEIWLLECNSKPGRQAFTFRTEQQSSLAIERPIQYCKYLAKRYNSFLHPIIM